MGWGVGSITQAVAGSLPWILSLALAAWPSVAAEQTGEPGDLLQRLDFPRDDSAGIERAAGAIATALENANLVPQTSVFAWNPHRAAATAVLWLAASACLAYASLRTRRRLAVAAALLVSGGVLTLAGALDPLLPSRSAANLELAVEPAGESRREVLLAAHYDSKTELFDHVERGVLLVSTAAAALAALLAARARPRASRLLGLATSLGLGLAGVHFASASWLPSRGHGIVDDAVACALLVEEASELRETPLRTTRVRFVWWAAEEAGAQGSAAFVRGTRTRPAAVVNLECVGAAPGLACAGLEWTGVGLARPDPTLVAALERAAGTALRRMPFPAVTDAGPWLRCGVPAVTVLNVEGNGLPPRHLHGRGDVMARVDPRGVMAVRRLLRAWLAAIDAPGGGAGTAE